VGASEPHAVCRVGRLPGYRRQRALAPHPPANLGVGAPLAIPAGHAHAPRLHSPCHRRPQIQQDGTGRRIRPPSRNALSAVFQQEDEGSRAAQAASSWAEQTGESKRMDQELEPQVSHSENLYRADLPALGFVVVVRFSMRLVIDTAISWSQFS
uniref:Uncharacterized protein n=1 Tax=Zea mays TaxID=4577 RepID=A0A804MSY3_MAIZE